jgi:E3 ubiquitin-protein ligase DMA1/2
VADLEAELDDPFTNGEWEEVEAADSDAPAVVLEPSEQVEVAENASNTRQPRQHGGPTEETAVLVEAHREEEEHDQSVPSDLDMAEASDDSGVDTGIHQAAEELGYMNIGDSPSPSSLGDSHPPDISNATVPPVNIISRKAVAGSSDATSSRLGQPISETERGMTRTPSPNGLGASLAEALTGVEGPMTPRNDIGPFVFDGSAGRASDSRLATMATMTLAATANTPPPQEESPPSS